MKTFSSEGNTISQENPDHGEILLFDQNFSELNQVPENYFLGSSSSDENSFLGTLYRFFWGVQKSDVRYGHKKSLVYTTRRTHSIPTVYAEKLYFLFNFVQFDSVKALFKIFFLRDLQKKESLFIGGFVPMTKCEYTIELEKPEKKGFVIIQTPCAKIVIDRKETDNYCIDSYFHSASKKFSFKRMIVPAKDGKISLKVFFDGIFKTNTVSAHDQDSIVTPFFSLTSSQLKYPSFSQEYIKISTIALPDQGTSTTLLYALSQSAPRKLITPIGDKTIQPLGFDGPHDYATLKNGLIYMENFGYRGTIWFDIGYLKDEHFNTFLIALIHDKSWEAGIHFSKSLTTLSSDEAFVLISDEYNLVTSKLGIIPKSWCSLRSMDTVTFANYLFDKYTMIWRNGETGVHAEPDVGNLDDTTWEWWNPASKAGLIYPVFTHQTDKEPGMKYSISFSKFKTWIDNYQAHGISIIPFHEWWLVNANTNDMVITNISEINNRLKFKVKTNGERGLINVNVSAERDLKIIDLTTGGVIKWKKYLDNSIIFNVQSNHEYEIFKGGNNASQ